MAQLLDYQSKDLQKVKNACAGNQIWPWEPCCCLKTIEWEVADRLNRLFPYDAATEQFTALR